MKKVSLTSDEIITMAKDLTERLAGTKLPPELAKLYSQFTRVRDGQPSLEGWRDSEITNRLYDVIRLIEAGKVTREAGYLDIAQKSLKRAAEILEWISHPELKPNGVPVNLLAAASYQLAGFPARSTGLLNQSNNEQNDSRILKLLLQSNYRQLLFLVADYWKIKYQDERLTERTKKEEYVEHIKDWIVKETISSIGLLIAYMRWGMESRLNKALLKLKEVSNLLIYNDKSYSWLLAEIFSEVAKSYINNSLRKNVQTLIDQANEPGQIALERYIRKSYNNGKTLVWPSQIRGIDRLNVGDSFALCTPTGSGKTSIAELSIIQSIFSNIENGFESLLLPKPIVMYLVPSKSLASEVEAKLSEVLDSIGQNKVQVTGLYGGIDWGPTDAWLTSADSTVLVCTYEKADALVRFLGPLFINRVSLIIIDEAHSIKFDGDFNALHKSENRSLRLESLGTRLFSHLKRDQCRIIALSAVADDIEEPLASWITKKENTQAVKTSYRSTRQLIGRLECLKHGRFFIEYDLMDGSALRLDNKERSSSKPFIPQPFPKIPAEFLWDDRGPEKKLQPYLLWFAMHFVLPNDKGHKRSVLISVTEGINSFTNGFLELLDMYVDNNLDLKFFQQPTSPKKSDTWNKCLNVCEDYFGKESREYKLLSRGIAVHHGSLPPLLSRMIIQLIQERTVNIVLATSTLSEGVNLPFELVLIPKLLRGNNSIKLNEFGNLVGRAGRPGVSTEGQSLILLSKQSYDRNRVPYENLVKEYEEENKENTKSFNYSPLAQLMIVLKEKWSLITKSDSNTEFLEWLEVTAPLTFSCNTEDELIMIESLDTMDSFLLTSIVEIEQRDNIEDISELELELKSIWNNSFARWAVNQEDNLDIWFIKRGIALKEVIYPHTKERKKLYSTSLPPRKGIKLIDLYPTIRQHLENGEEYALWDPKRQFEYIYNTVDLLSGIEAFEVKENVGRSNKVKWFDVLEWWLNPKEASKQPTIKQISDWHKFINNNFIYRFNWGLGSVIALSIDEIDDCDFMPTTLEDWPKLGLPWIVFWLKELIVWGTLDPVASYLLSNGLHITRVDAERNAELYYLEHSNLNSNEILNPLIIREWTNTLMSKNSKENILTPPKIIEADLLRDFPSNFKGEWVVIPIEVDAEIIWIDPAGYPLAISKKPIYWEENFINNYDFILDVQHKLVKSNKYLN